MSRDNQPQTLRRLASDPRMPNVGDLVHQRYRILDVLGEGGFAVVYRAKDDKLGGEVAFKVLEPGKSADTDFARRFHQEINLVRQLRHHNTIKIWDAGTTENGCLYMATELIEGVELSKMIAPGEGLPLDRVVRIVSQVLRSLAEAHKVGIIHRDLKPSNIMVSQLEGEADYVKVLDFGIAKALEPGLSMVETQTGLVMCTPSYASPEVLRGQTLRPASDLYSLGLIMVEMLTGQQAVQGESLVDIMGQQISPTPITMPPELAHTPIGLIVSKSIAKRVEDRYQSAVEMLEALKLISSAVPITPGYVSQATAETLLARAGYAYPTSQPVPVSPQTKSRRVVWIGVPLVLLLGLAIAMVLILTGRTEEQGPVAGTSGDKPIDTVVPTGQGISPIQPTIAVPPQGSQVTSPPVVAEGHGVPGQQSAAVVPYPEQPGVISPPQGPVGPFQGATPGEPSSTSGPAASSPGASTPTDESIQAAIEQKEPDLGPDGQTAGSSLSTAALAPLEPGQVRATVAYRSPRGEGTLLILNGCGESSGLSEGDEGTIEGTEALATITLIASEEDCEAETTASMDELETARSVLFAMETPEDQSAAAPSGAEGTVTLRIEGTPRSVRLYWRYADQEDADWSDSERCSRPCEFELPAIDRPIEIRARKSDHCSDSIEVNPSEGEGPYVIDLQPGCGRARGHICNNTCRYAYDHECDDGGPRSLYNLCPYGSDCYDCGPRPVR